MSNALGFWGQEYGEMIEELTEQTLYPDPQATQGWRCRQDWHSLKAVGRIPTNKPSVTLATLEGALFHGMKDLEVRRCRRCGFIEIDAIPSDDLFGPFTHKIGFVEVTT